MASFYINPKTGIDINSVPGSRANPFRTLTYALKKRALSGDEVKLAPGTYSLATGESFPIVIPSGVTVKASEDSKGRDVLIEGGGRHTSPSSARYGFNVTFVIEKNSQLQDVTVSNTNLRGTGVWIESPSIKEAIAPTVTNCTFLNCNMEGVFVAGGANPKILDSVFLGNKGYGISINAKAKGEIRGNRFERNTVAISTRNEVAPAITNNTISENIRSGIIVSGSSKPILRNNRIEDNGDDGVVVISQAFPNLGEPGVKGGNIFINNGRNNSQEYYDLNNASANTLISNGNQLNPERVKGSVNFLDYRILTFKLQGRLLNQDTNIPLTGYIIRPFDLDATPTKQLQDVTTDNQGDFTLVYKFFLPLQGTGGTTPPPKRRFRLRILDPQRKWDWIEQTEIEVLPDVDIGQRIEIPVAITFPLLLFPVRLETRFLGDDLWVRIYPDQIFVNTHEPRLTKTELDAGKRYLSYLNKGTSDEEKRNAWRELARLFGPERAAWIAKSAKTVKETNNPDLSGEDESWLVVPKLMGLPDHFVAFAYRDGHLVGEPVVVVGKPVRQDLTLLAAPLQVTYEQTEIEGPGILQGKVLMGKSEPISNLKVIIEGTSQTTVTDASGQFRFSDLSESQLTLRLEFPNNDSRSVQDSLSVGVRVGVGTVTILLQEAIFDEKSRWIVDYQQAEDAGMAVKIPLSLEDKNKGFSRLIVVGIRTTNPEEGQQRLMELVENHHYSSGVAFLDHGTPTNNTQSGQSGYSATTEDREGSYDIEVLGPSRWAGSSNEPRNTERLGCAFGLGDKLQVFDYIAGAGDTADAYAKEMRTALWPVTGDYLLRYLLPDIVSEANLKKLARHFISYVWGSGPLPAIRVGEQPYGILPVTSIYQWEASHLDNSKDSNGETFDSQLHSTLLHLFEKWFKWANDSQRVPRVGGTAGDPDKDLLQILAMEPISISYQERPFVDERFVAWLLVALRNDIFGTDTPYGAENPSPLYWMQKWAEMWLAHRHQEAELWHGLTGASIDILENAPLLRLLSWGDGRDLGLKLTSFEDTTTKELPIQYLRELCQQCQPDGSVNPGQSFTLLRDLLVRSLALAPQSSLDRKVVCDAICRLSGSAMLNFFNTVTAPGQLAARLEVVGASLAQTLLNTRNALSDGQFTSLEQIAPVLNGQNLSYILNVYSDRPLKPDIERLFRETLDLCTHRLDAWITSLATKRLHAMRQDHPTGIGLGAYGWVEDLKPAPEQKQSQGFIHAPSPGQAAAAAVLHNAYLTHADSNATQPNPFRINLNSERVRRALQILEGMRQGQPLGALLGYQFERALHDQHLDQFIDDFRAAFPLVANKETAPNQGDSVEAITARNVVDGLTLARWWQDPTRTDITRGNADAIGTMMTIRNSTNLKYKLLQREVNNLLNNLDAVSDVLMYEGVYHTVQGNFERAGAALEAASGNAVPPEIESVRTPVGGKFAGQRVCLLFPPQSPDNTLTPRVQAEPSLAAWFGSLLGDLTQIVCGYSFLSIGRPRRLNLQQLAISAIDILYLSASPPIGGETEIEQRIRYWVRETHRQTHELTYETAVEIDFSRPTNGTDGYSITEAIELGRQVLNTLGAGSILRPGSLCLAADADTSSYSTEDVDDLKLRVEAAQTKLNGTANGTEGLIALLTKPVGDGSQGTATRNDIIDALFEASLFGVSGAIPPGPDDPDLDPRRQKVVAELSQRSRESQKLQQEATQEEPNRQMALLVEAMKALFGRSFVVLPTFEPPKVDKLAQAFSQSDLLAGQGEQRVWLWLQQAARVHPPLRELEDAGMLAEAWQGKPALTLRVAQLPFDPENRWLALDDGERGASYDKSRDRGALSIVAAFAAPPDVPVLNPQASNMRLAGLLLEQWNEFIPSKTVNTSVSFQYNAPNAQAPQSLLLAVPSQRSALTWEVDELAQIVCDTLDLTKVRAVDLDAMGASGDGQADGQGVGAVLPALMFPADATRPGYDREGAIATIQDWLKLLERS